MIPLSAGPMLASIFHAVADIPNRI